MTDKTLGPDRKPQIDFIEEYMKQKHEPVYKGGDIANYGTIPLFKSENEFNFFGHKLDLIFDNTRKKIMGKGQLRSFASELTRLKVGIPEDLSNEEKINISKEICKKTSFETTEHSINLFYFGIYLILMHALEFEGVSKSFAEKNVIRDISFSVEKGEIFGLLGPNGAGKTTLIRLLLDIIKPDSGEIRVFGGSLTPIAKDRIGYLPEERGLYRKTKLLDMLVYLAQLKNVPKKEAKENAEELLKSLELYEHRGKRVEELSKGMQQKVQFLSSIIHDPELIILDEPFSGLDPVSTKTIKAKILEYRNEGRTVILSTHIMEQAQKLCDRILMINKGQRVLYGTVEGIRKEHGKNSLLVEFADKGSLSLVREIPGIKKITEHRGSLEIFPEEGIDAQAILQELIRKTEILRFEQMLPSLNDIFIETVESASGE